MYWSFKNECPTGEKDYIDNYTHSVQLFEFLSIYANRFGNFLEFWCTLMLMVMIMLIMLMVMLSQESQVTLESDTIE